MQAFRFSRRPSTSCRTRKVRFDSSKFAGSSTSGAFVNVTMEAPLGEGLAVPESAVIRTGARSIVFVVHGEGTVHIEPREVTLGHSSVTATVSNEG